MVDLVCRCVKPAAVRDDGPTPKMMIRIIHRKVEMRQGINDIRWRSSFRAMEILLLRIIFPCKEFGTYVERESSIYLLDNDGLMDGTKQSTVRGRCTVAVVPSTPATRLTPSKRRFDGFGWL